MIIFLFGPETFLASLKLKEIVKRYKEIYKSQINLKVFEAEELDFQKFKEAFFSLGMFDGKKLIILKDIFSNQEFLEKFEKEKEKFVASKDIVLIYEKGEPKNSPLFNFLLKNSKWQRFDPIEGQRLRYWAKKRFLEYGVKIENEALEKLIFFVGNDLWRLENEIQKLVCYKKKEKIVEKDIEILTEKAITTDIFKTIDAISQKKKGIALKLIHKHIKSGDNPFYLLAMINFQFKNLLLVKDFMMRKKSYSEILRESGLHPLVFKKSYFQSQKFSLEELKKICQKIFQIEIFTKTGKIEPSLALDFLIAEI